ncbi:hypothetical protein EDB80DRAFT_679664 [Ilyonectria destructans]|nr:hypothetical protein EDB80DRAFT_679664 [Ilyonectria destructans]
MAGMVKPDSELVYAWREVLLWEHEGIVATSHGPHPADRDDGPILQTAMKGSTSAQPSAAFTLLYRRSSILMINAYDGQPHTKRIPGTIARGCMEPVSFLFLLQISSCPVCGGYKDNAIRRCKTGPLYLPQTTPPIQKRRRSPEPNTPKEGKIPCSHRVFRQQQLPKPIAATFTAFKTTLPLALSFLPRWNLQLAQQPRPSPVNVAPESKRPPHPLTGRDRNREQSSVPTAIDHRIARPSGTRGGRGRGRGGRVASAASPTVEEVIAATQPGPSQKESHSKLGATSATRTSRPS